MTYVKFLKHMAIESVRHIKDKVSPTEFAVAYLELLRETVAHPEMVAFSAARPWEDMREFLLPLVDEDGRDILHTAEAKEFYEAWVAMVSTEIWLQYTDQMVPDDKEEAVEEEILTDDSN